MSRVAVVFTGGTISMGFDPVAGGNVPSLDGAAILARTPGLDALADVVPIDRGLTPASHFTFRDLLTLAGVIQAALDDDAIDGVVVVQGTDTIEETSFAWDLVLESSKPVVVTGAMRASHEDGYDGPANLRRAVAAAASPTLRDAGVVVALAGTIEAADDVTKMHTTAFDTFRSPNRGSLGTIGEASDVQAGVRGPRRRLQPAPSDGARVELVEAGIGTDRCGRRGRRAWRRRRSNGSGEHFAADARRGGTCHGERDRRGPGIPMSGGRRYHGLRVSRGRRDVGARRGDPSRNPLRDQGAGRALARAGDRPRP
jgi:L-asparaginase